LLDEQIQQLFPPRKKKLLIIQHKKEIVGLFILSELSFFDTGRSFMADSLHNVYIEAFVG
jgi:hypothetical protein